MRPSRTPLAFRPGCRAYGIAPSISSSIADMPQSKPAGVRCVQFSIDHRCKIVSQPEGPTACSGLRPYPEMCVHSREQPLRWPGILELDARPGDSAQPGQDLAALPATVAHTASSRANKQP